MKQCGTHHSHVSTNSVLQILTLDILDKRLVIESVAKMNDLVPLSIFASITQQRNVSTLAVHINICDIHVSQFICTPTRVTSKCFFEDILNLAFIAFVKVVAEDGIVKVLDSVVHQLKAVSEGLSNLKAFLSIIRIVVVEIHKSR